MVADHPERRSVKDIRIKLCLTSKDLIDGYRTIHLTLAKYKFLALAHGTFSRVEHVISPK
jgi:hypothetical protein